MVSDEQKGEILRDLPKLHDVILTCEKSKLQYEQNIIQEQQHMMDLRIAMSEDDERVEAGKRPLFEKDAMKVNIQRHKNNIELFKDTIEKENATIFRVQGMIKVLQEDLEKKPEVITFDARGKNGDFDLRAYEAQK